MVAHLRLTAAVSLQLPLPLLGGTWALHILGAAGNKHSINLTAIRNLNSTQPVLDSVDAAGTSLLGTPLAPSLPRSLPPDAGTRSRDLQKKQLAAAKARCRWEWRTQGLATVGTRCSRDSLKKGLINEGTRRRRDLQKQASPTFRMLLEAMEAIRKVSML